MMYADYDYYTNNYGGSEVSEADFPRFAARAGAYLDKLTFGRAAAHADDERLKNCFCEICDLLKKSHDSGGAVKTSESVGSWSVSYDTAGSSSSEADKVRSCCQLWLPSEWLYRGVGRE